MPSRGGNASMDWMAGLPAMPQAAQPSLLQMADGGQQFGTWAPRDYSQVAVPQLYSGGGGGGSRSGGGVGMGPFNPPPDLAKYFDASGEYKIDDPRQVAAEGGISLAQLASGILPRSKNQGQGYEFASDKGGFFKIEDLYGLGGPPTLPQQRDPSRRGGGPPERNPSHVDVPGIATHGMSGPSTNNWRLLGMGPGWIMRNGSLINTQAPEVTRGAQIGSDMGVGITAEHGMSAQRGSQLGTGGSMGMPNRWGDSYYWPGAATGGLVDRWPANTNV